MPRWRMELTSWLVRIALLRYESLLSGTQCRVPVYSCPACLEVDYTLLYTALQADKSTTGSKAEPLDLPR